MEQVFYRRGQRVKLITQRWQGKAAYGTVVEDSGQSRYHRDQVKVKLDPGLVRKGRTRFYHWTSLEMADVVDQLGHLV